MKQKAVSGNFNQSIIKAFSILELISHHPEGLRLTDISRTLSIDKATTLRFLSTLEHIGFIKKKNDNYLLGLKLYEFGLKVPFKTLVVDKVHNILERLVEEINETVNFGVLHEGKVLYLDKIESKRSLQINTHIGDKISLHCTALGKSILSSLPTSDLKCILNKIKLKKKTKNTISSRDKLVEEINTTKKKGYSVDNEEFEEGLRCVAVPIKFEEIGFYGAISVSGPTTRFTEEHIPYLGKVLKKYAKIIITELNKDNKMV